MKKVKQKQKQKQSQTVNINLGNVLKKKSKPRRKPQPKQPSPLAAPISFNAPPIREYVDTSLYNIPSRLENPLLIRQPVNPKLPENPIQPANPIQPVNTVGPIQSNNPLFVAQQKKENIMDDIPIAEAYYSELPGYTPKFNIKRKKNQLTPDEIELRKEEAKQRNELKKAETIRRNELKKAEAKAQALRKKEEKNAEKERKKQELNPPTNPLLSEPVNPPTITSEPVPNPNITIGIETDAQRAERILQENRRKKEERKAFLESQQSKPIDKKKEDYLNAASPGRNRIIDESITEPTLTDEPIQPPGISEGLGQTEPEVKKKTKGKNKKTAVI